MFWFFAYLAVAYGGVILVCVALSGLLRKFRLKVGWKLALYALLMLSPLLPYGRVALQTARFRVELMPAFRAASTQINGEWQAPSIFRVMSIDNSRALVYSVDSCGAITHDKRGAGGTLWELKKTSRGWEFTDDFDAVWSDCGSAEGNTFPPYPEARSF